MKKRTKTPPKLTKSQQKAIGITIAAQAEKGMKAFVVAGAEILQERYGFSQEQAAAWATETIQLGTKYLRLDSGDKVETQ